MSFIGRILGDTPLHARAADFGQEVDSARSVRERLLVLGHHGVLNGSRWEVTERRTATRYVFAAFARRWRTGSFLSQSNPLTSMFTACVKGKISSLKLLKSFY